MWTRSKAAEDGSAALNQGSERWDHWWTVWKWIEDALFKVGLVLLAICGHFRSAMSSSP
jgi:hypothetical protein